MNCILGCIFTRSGSSPHVNIPVYQRENKNRYTKVIAIKLHELISNVAK
jgi:hypothetical protein